MAGPNERDVVMIQRGHAASAVKQYIEDWQQQRLEEIDRRAIRALNDGDLDKRAMTLWVDRIEVLNLVKTIELDEKRGRAAAGRMAEALVPLDGPNLT